MLSGRDIIMTTIRFAVPVITLTALLAPAAANHPGSAQVPVRTVPAFARSGS
jgi:hypothetical protein